MYCAIDFGTSNSGIAVPAREAGGTSPMRLVELEAGHPTMPTAVFYASDGVPQLPPPTRYGRAAIAAYVEGHEGRLMRSMKSILGSTLADRATDIGGGRQVGYLDVVSGYLRELRRRAEADSGHALDRVVLGRPVFFVDDDAARDAAAEASLREAAARAGFREVALQYEPIAAAFDHERTVTREETVLVADIGGGTSDFSLVRVGPGRAGRTNRKDDILANHGVHVAGTDFDRRIELRSILPLAGYGARGPARPGGEPPREVPSGVYFDLATWHLVNTLYGAPALAEARALKPYYADPALHRRLMRILELHLGHDLLARAEAAKIAVASGGEARVDLGAVERGIACTVNAATATDALEADLERVVDAARQTVRDAGLAPTAVDALYFTGGSTGLAVLTERLGAAFPAARAVRGDRFASVATGLGLHAARLFGPTSQPRPWPPSLSS